MGILRRRNDAVLLEPPHGREDGEHVAFEVAQILIGGDECAVDELLVVYAAAEEVRVVAHVEQREERRHQVDLRDDAFDALRLHEARSVDQGRNVVLVQRNLGAAGARCAVVRRDEENRVVEPRLPRSFREELTEGVVGIHHAAVAGLRVVGNADLSGRVGEGAVVADRHDVGEEGLAALRVFVERADDLAVGVFVAYAPDVGERDLFGRILPLVHDVVAVARKEGLHVVEVAVAAVEILDVIALFAQQRTRGVHAGVVRPLDDTLAGAGRQREGYGFQSAHRAVARRVYAVEGESLLVKRVEYGRQAVRVAETLHERSAHALDRNQHDVAADFGSFAAYGVQVVARAAVNPMDEGFGLLFGFGDVELLVVEFVLDECVVEFVEPVGLQLVYIDILAVLKPGVEVQQPDGEEHGGDVRRPCDRFPAPAFQPVGEGQIAAEEIPCHDQRHEDQPQRHRHDGVGLHDVADHLVGVDEVVYRNEVVAYAEFAPEEIFAESVEEDGAHVERDDEREPYRGPVAAETLEKETQGERAGPIAQNGGGDLRRDAAVFVEDRVAEGHVAECRNENSEDDVAPRFAVLGFGDAHREEP